MGGSSSTPTRNITIQEDGSSGITVSEAVARRLEGRPDGPTKSKEADPEVRVAELKKMQNFYENRIQALEQMNKDLHQTTKEQFAKAVEDVETKFLKTTSSPVCEDLQTEVLKCYQANPKHTLNCSPQVKAFSECVQKQRESLLQRQG